MTIEYEESIPAFGVASRLLAEQAAIERLLNAYLRETGAQLAPISVQELLACGVAPQITKQLFAEGTPFRVQLPQTKIAVLGALTYRSAVGHHQFAGSFWVAAAGPSSYQPIEGALAFADILLTELAAAPSAPQLEKHKQELLDQIEASIEKTTRLIEWRYRQAEPPHRHLPINTFLAAEQALVFGHPLHPTPKSSEGFSNADLERYTPEMGAAFALHYFAVAPVLVCEDFLPHYANTFIPALVQRAAERYLAPPQRRWPLLPCHPWQMNYLCEHPDVKELIERGQLINLGPLGDKVYPTSSVRTILEPSIPCFFKLPLNVRITHFVRTNPLEHLHRSMDVSRILAQLGSAIEHPHYTILREIGYRTILPHDWEAGCQSTLAASCGVMFRETPPITTCADPMVLASLLEPDLHSGEPVIIHFVRRAIGTYRLTPADVGRWLRRYLEIAVLPTLQIFLDHGISLEAHVQNTLVAFEAGWPRHTFVRDLEGTSIIREHAATQGWLGTSIAEQSPALYTPDNAWNRLKYYLFVNHLSHLIAALACYGAGDELQLWQIVRTALQQYAKGLQHYCARSYLEELLEEPMLPAKANLLSRFHQRGETPLYVAIPNPLHEGKYFHA